MCEATHDLLRNGRPIRTRCIMTCSWPSRAADRTIRACGIRFKREKLRRSTSGVDIGLAQAGSECYENEERKIK